MNFMNSRFLIYGLIDPRSGELRYVGKSCSGMKRPGQHAQASYLRKRGGTHAACWVQSLLLAGLKPEVEVLETHGTAEALVEAEKHFIAYFRSIGCRLTNLTDGGDGGGFRGRKHSPATRAKMSASQLVLQASPSMKQKQSDSHRGKVLGPMPLALRVAQVKVHGSQPVMCVGTGAIYIGATEAARVLGLHTSNVSKAAKGIIRHTGGHSFKYVEAACS